MLFFFLSGSVLRGFDLKLFEQLSRFLSFPLGCQFMAQYLLQTPVCIYLSNHEVGAHYQVPGANNC